jgi:large subunit ribosomal protein L17
MRHRVSKKHFNKDTKHRKAMFRGLVEALITHGEITTTESKGKEVKRISDKLIFKALKDDLSTRRRLHRFFGKRQPVNVLVDRVAPIMNDRIGGYSRVTKIGKRRGDNAKLVKVSLVVKPEKLGSMKSGIDYSNSKKKTTSRKKSKSKKTKKK